MTARAVVLAIAACGGGQRPATAPACGAAIVIASQADVVRLDGCTAIDSLIVRTGAPVDLAALATLREIRGDVTIGPTVAMTEIHLPAIERIAGVLRISANGSASGVFLPRLRDAGGIAVVDNPALATIAMPELVAITGELVVRNNAVLEVFVAPRLASVAGRAVPVGVVPGAW